MRKSFHQTLSILAICLLLSQTIFGSLPVFAQTNSDALTITMTENGQTYTEGSVATSPVTIQVVTTSPDSAGIELSQDLGTTWKPFDTAVPLVLEDAGDHDIWFRPTDSDGQAVIEKRHIQITTAALLSRQATGPIIYVDANSTAANGGDGTSWATAYKDLQAALTAAVAGQEIWIAAGTYKPTKLSNSPDLRTASFQMKNDVKIYGGFVGTENALAERDFKKNETILSGDIGTIGDNTDNAYHVFYHPAGLNLDHTAILDGVTITGGNANGGFLHNNGGGMSNSSSSPTVTNVEFSGNEATNAGGGMSNGSSSPTVTNVVFRGNTASYNGGGMFNFSDSRPTVTDVAFRENTANNYGGGMYNISSSPIVTNVVFRENKAPYAGGGMYNDSSSPTVTNVEFSGNTANYGGGMSNEGNSRPTLTNVTMSGHTANGPAIYNRDSAVSVPKIHNSIIVGNNGPAYNGTPTIKNSLIGDNQKGQLYDSAGKPVGQEYLITAIFKVHANKDYRLKAGSPAIDKGVNSDNTTLTDLDGKPRVHGGVIDLGAYEYQVSHHKVTYNGNGAMGGQAPSSATHEENATVTVSGNTGNLVKPNHTFTGWNTQANGTGTAYAAGETFQMGKAAVTLYAQWKAIPTYTVTYDGNGATGGQVPTSESYEENATVTVAGNTGNLVKSIYTFTGWNTQADGKGTTYATGKTFQMGKAAVTLYAQWRVNAPIPPTPTYTVTYNGNGSTGGQAPTSALYQRNAMVTVAGNKGNLVNPNHIFTGWNTEADGTGTAYAAGATFQMGTANVTLYAQWKAIPTYTVTYDGNGATSGQAPPSATHEENVTVTVGGNTGNLVKSNHTFTSWNTQADGKGTAYAEGATFQMGTANVTLHAQWKAIPTYEITYDRNGATGGQTPSSASYEENAMVTVQGNTGNLVKPNHTFTGWNTQANGTGTAYAAGATFQMGKANVTLYVQWKAIPTYEVTYNGNGATSGQVPTSANYEENTTVTVQGNTGNLVKPNHTFTGWNTEANGTGTAYAAGETFQMGTANVTLYAQWKANPTYTVTYNGNGATSGQVPTSTFYEENATVTVQGNSSNLVKPNHTFTGWNTQSDGTGTAYATGATFQMGKANVTLYAQWKVNPPTPGGDTTQPPTSSNDSDNTYSPPTTVKITLHSNDGTIIEPINITYNTKVSDLPVPTRAGFRFEGWYEDEALTKRWADGTLVRENIALYAKWTALPAVEPEPETPQEPQPPTLPQPTVTFGDVEQHWAQEMIEELATLGIIQGYEDGTFRPNAPISRMHVAALLTRAFPFENVREGKDFSDVSPVHPYYDAILTLQQAGIIDGRNGAFLPKENMTRAELAKVLVGVLGFTPEGTASFSDVASTHWSTGYIAVLEREGIALGDNGKYGPNDPVTRAQFVAFLYRILQLQKQ